MFESISAYFDLEKKPITAAILRSILFWSLILLAIILDGAMWILIATFNLGAIIVLFLSIMISTRGFAGRPHRITRNILPLLGTSVLLYYLPTALTYVVFAILLARTIRIHKNAAVDFACRILFVALFLAGMLEFLSGLG